MDRLAFQNMTTKGRNPVSGPEEPALSYYQQVQSQSYGNEVEAHPSSTHQQAYFAHNYNKGHATLDNLQRPTGEVTTKSKLNHEINDYHLERQSKNQGAYNNFVSALNSNIKEDQQRTQANNDRWQNEQREMDNFQRVYHPTLAYDNRHEQTASERGGKGTRNRQENGMAKTVNTATSAVSGGDLPMPLPRLNYPTNFDAVKPMEMDMESHLSFQFQTLADEDMNRQINALQKRMTKHTAQSAQSVSQTPMDRQTCYQVPMTMSYNPHADYLNGQLSQMSRQMPDDRNTLAQQLQSSQAMHGLTNIPNIPMADALNFQRPTSSNLKSLDPLLQGYGQNPPMVNYGTGYMVQSQ